VRSILAPAAGHLLCAALALCTLSCSGGRQSADLALSLFAGMQRSERFSTHILIESTPVFLPGILPTTRPSTRLLDMHIAVTYHFRVVSADRAGSARLYCTADNLSIDGSPKAFGAAARQSITQPFILILDRDGRVVDIQRAGGTSASDPTFDLTQPSARTAGDMGSMFDALPAGRVPVGKTWTTRPKDAGASGGATTMQWTLESVGDRSARIGFHGSITRRLAGRGARLAAPPPAAAAPVGVPAGSVAPGAAPADTSPATEPPATELPGGTTATTSGDVSGFLVVETKTGWPLQGKTVSRMRITMTNASGATRHYQAWIETLFDPGS
jgi:hypothetical protein